MHISDQFDGGNITVVSLEDADNIQLEIKKDNQSDFYQWFYFRFVGEVGKKYQFHITNAVGAAYAEGWDGYQVLASYDRENWFRMPTRYENGVLSVNFGLEEASLFFAYFEPYSYERHLDLLQAAMVDERVSMHLLGQTLDGRDINMLQVGEATASYKVWLIARQHPGETMAEWLIEGTLEALLNPNLGVARQLLKQTVFYIVPNMNPDGSVRGHLRTNAAGINLNREWQSPSLEKSPEVFLVRKKMHEIGGDIFLDIHGDEVLPYNFVVTAEGIPNYSDYIANLEQRFKDVFLQLTPEFQVEHGYPVDQPGQANLSMAASYLANHFQTLSMTLEMPFKDNQLLADPLTGWSAERSKQLGKDILIPIWQTLDLIEK
ncbi:carboxypeptidase family protein [Endozoicomonas sp. SM1973]|uniref:Carboxypeptidase family protein n=1 Tax=Spartinivicinus marinus TaxID=2994442 RepID=A0A853IIJ9_9GAMM|nr:carboxypeptidase family protein [Spartinivicinus marinus]MCX4025352.1 M14-type cytosolic carboxypeptidase [Spartinivicinus marinus]NYZ68925.1 carboxypeptidase family protein [Spartinivicinus marinus]